jgi:folate-dependent phosphoribosylglycinamide formyltransferase PurN
MRIFITTMDEPYFMNPFIAKILKERKNDIIGLASSKGGRLTTRKKRLDISYAVTLFLIIGLKNSMKIGYTSFLLKIQKKLINKIHVKRPLSIIQIAQQLDIPTWEVDTVNDAEFLAMLEKIKPDLIINQAQEIVKSGFINIPPFGVLNRHSSLLPKNRGRLTPFWVLFRQETETGVSIHFVTEEIDRGDIICQEKISVEKTDDFLTLTQKGYTIAADLMLSAIKKIESGKFEVTTNDPAKGNYNTIPTLSEALTYRKNGIVNLVKRWI